MALEILARHALAVALLTAATPAPAQAPALGTQYTPPAGWARAEKEGTVYLMPGSEPPGTVLLSILPLTPRQPDLDAQVTAVRTTFEASLGLGRMRDASSRRGAGAGFETRVHAATYASAAGERRFALMAHAEGGMVGFVFLLTTSGQAYERHRGAATALFEGLRLVPYADPSAEPAPQAGGPAPAASAGATTSAPPAAPTATPPVAASAGAGNYRGQGIVGVWTGTRMLRDYSRGFSMLIAIPAWYVLFDDGALLQTFPLEGLAGFDRAAFRARYPREWHTWSFDGLHGTVQRQEGAAPWTLTQVGPNHLQIDGTTFRRCPDVDGLRLQGDWYQQSGADADDPDFTRRPRGVRPLIHFTREGRFDDEGLFAVGITSRTGGDDRAGAGTYEIRDFSIIFRYDDGRTRQEAFPGRGPELSPAGGKDERIFIRDAGLIKR